MGKEVSCCTDHASLTWLQNFKEPEDMIARWLTLLDTYAFTVEYRKGGSRRCKCRNCIDCYNFRSKDNTLPGTLAPESSICTLFSPDDCSDGCPELHALNPCPSSSQKGILMPEALSAQARAGDVQCSSI